jgi:hypothetical protein
MMILGKFVSDRGDAIRKAGVNHAPTIRALVTDVGIYAPTIVSGAMTIIHIFATDALKMATILLAIVVTRGLTRIVATMCQPTMESIARMDARRKKTKKKKKKKKKKTTMYAPCKKVPCAPLEGTLHRAEFPIMATLSEAVGQSQPVPMLSKSSAVGPQLATN